ncbi:MAG: dTDP-4-dehydrorhamnose reductase [Dyella sp.]|uniref:dTDP-4-dehydrorhamnose reductase n=1 Tax=Dyella sp. TaxID=1869338 RepID=UPI003F7CE462
MRFLLLGGNGQLARSFVAQGGLAARGELVIATRDGRLFDGRSVETADLAAPEFLPALLDRVRPDVIINTAAYTAVDRAEQEESLAGRINGEAVGVLGRWAAAHGALVVHYSTDYVFDGSATAPYPLDAPTVPLGAYGRSKLAGEIALRESGAAHMIFRTAWVYAPHGHNFLRTMLRLAGERDTLNVVADQVGAPTSTDIIVAGTLAALDRWLPADARARAWMEGVHHLVASGHTSWHGFAEAIFDDAVAAGLLTRAPRVNAIGTEQFPTPARRPAWSVLANEGMTQHFGYTPPAWRVALPAVIDALRAD